MPICIAIPDTTVFQKKLWLILFLTLLHDFY